MRSSTSNHPEAADPAGPGVRTRPPPLVDRPMAVLMAITLGALAAFYLLASAVPLYVADTGSGGAGAGLSMGTLMLATVLLELGAPRLIGRYGYRTVIVAGLLLLGLPTLALTVTSALPVVLAVCLARGAGLGIFFVASIALVAELVPARRRGEGLGLYGAVSSVPSIVCLPLGVWLGREVGFDAVFVAGAALALLPLALAGGLPARGRGDRAADADADADAADAEGAARGAAGGNARPAGSRLVDGLRDAALLRPAVIFMSVTVAAGVIVTFLPLAVPADRLYLASWGLFLQSVTTPVARWWAGRYGDRRGHARLLPPGIAASAAGVGALVWVDGTVPVLLGMAVFGVGFGVVLNATQSVMFARVGTAEFGKVSAVWSLAYDGGLGLGALGLGLLVGAIGYPAGFGLAAAAVAATGLVWWFDRRAGAPGGHAD